MVRAQVQFTEEQHRQLKRWARGRGISLSEAVRRCVAERLSRDSLPTGRDSRVREALAIIGKFADEDGHSRVARDHDEHLAEAFRR